MCEFVILLQQADNIEMLNTMVWTAAKWMWLGMPLQQLKIVIYSQNPDDPDDITAKECLKCFRIAKVKIEKIKRLPKVSIFGQQKTVPILDNMIGHQFHF